MEFSLLSDLTIGCSVVFLSAVRHAIDKGLSTGRQTHRLVVFRLNSLAEHQFVWRADDNGGASKRVSVMRLETVRWIDCESLTTHNASAKASEARIPRVSHHRPLAQNCLIRSWWSRASRNSRASRWESQVQIVSESANKWLCGSPSFAREC